MQSIRSGVGPDVGEDQRDDGDKQHRGTGLAYEMNRQWAIIVLRQNQYQNSHNHISQTDDYQHPPWNDVRDSQSKYASEDQQTIGNRIENLPDFAHLIE